MVWPTRSGTLAWDFVGAYGVIFRRVGLSPNRLAHYDAWAYRQDRASLR